MAVQRQQFAVAQRPEVAKPIAIDPRSFENKEWSHRRREVHFWQRERRHQLRSEVRAHAEAAAGEAYDALLARHGRAQADADAWWEALCRGDQAVVTSALEAAFADNAAPVHVTVVSNCAAVLLIALPGTDVLLLKKANVTPTGRLSSKAWSKTEFNELYAQLLGAHLLATLREAWAVAPALSEVRAVAVRSAAGSTAGVLFDVDVARSQSDWTDAIWVDSFLAEADNGLLRVGAAREVRVWGPAQLRRGVRYEDGVVSVDT